MRRLSDLFAEAAERCADLPQLGALLGDAALELGFHHFALLDHASLSGPPTGLLRIDNYPQSWVMEIEERGYAADDPVHLASRRTNAGFGWSELGRLISLEPRHQTILSRSRHHGIGVGFTIPAHVPGEPAASCSFAVRAGCALPSRRLACAELVGVHALRAARRLRPFAEPSPRPRLAGAKSSACALSRSAKLTGKWRRSSGSASIPRANM
jgi:LuxR family quorum-sensing system transcriptional regulator CciR